MQNWPFYFLLLMAFFRLGGLDLAHSAWRRVRSIKRTVLYNILAVVSIGLYLVWTVTTLLIVKTIT